ncbi:MAG: hypothetical protein GX025_10295 [Clostridiales bacterium]|nr:hypothetical protein [Clostridiales bacterium]
MSSHDNPKTDVNQEFKEETNANKNQEFYEEINKGLQKPREKELQSYYDSQEIANSILHIISLYPEETRNADGTLDEKAIQRLLLNPDNLSNPIAWGKKREQFLEKNPKSISRNMTVTNDEMAMGLYRIGFIEELVDKGLAKLPYSGDKYERLIKVREISKSFIDQANDQIESGGKVSDDFITKFIESHNPDWNRSSKDETKTPASGSLFDNDDDEGTSTSSGNDRALSAFEETLFKTASKANDIIDRLKELYNEVYDGRGISSAQERAEPGWKPSYLDRQFDLRVMDIEEQSKSRNRALILTMAGIDLRGEMEEARKLISFKTKELRDIGHDPDGFRRTQYQKQSQFLLQSFGLLMQIAPNAFGAKYGITQNALALANGRDPRSITNLGNQYPGVNPNLLVNVDESGEQ